MMVECCDEEFIRPTRLGVHPMMMVIRKSVLIITLQTGIVCSDVLVF